MEKLAERNVGKVLDLLTERLTFERSVGRLYDTILSRLRASVDGEMKALLPQIQEFRDQEHEHEEWLEDAIGELGGDANAETERAHLVKEESAGLEDVVMHDHELPHLFHALLTAELVDNAGWDLLMQLADDANDDAAYDMFDKWAREEEEHLAFVRQLVQSYARDQVRGVAPSVNV
jgi:bacterioferritin (cytochrome b1)